MNRVESGQMVSNWNIKGRSASNYGLPKLRLTSIIPIGIFINRKPGIVLKKKPQPIGIAIKRQFEKKSSKNRPIKIVSLICSI